MKKLLFKLLLALCWVQVRAQTNPPYPTAPTAPQNIIAAEYFIDTDPGLGNGTSISITPGVNLSNKTVAINTAGLVNGVHRVYLRTKSGEGNWSMANVKDFIVNF
ncbi:MAG: hypothetical protein JSS78_10595, partial [Bacteroidetes bacterium]|nr:hypothetical protein [Bacteroidota bacterium]